MDMIIISRVARFLHTFEKINEQKSRRALYFKGSPAFGLMHQRGPDDRVLRCASPVKRRIFMGFLAFWYITDMRAMSRHLHTFRTLLAHA